MEPMLDKKNCNENSSDLLLEALPGDDNTNNYEEEGEEDLDSTTEARRVKKGKYSKTPFMLYNKLTTSFQPLTENMLKHPDLVN